MNVKTYSKKNQGNIKVSNNFSVKEFACNDGSDTVKICLDNVHNLQKIREHFGKPITITSAYRTPSYNTKIGGAKNSYHTKGQATDIIINGIEPHKVAMYAESIGCGGVIWYPLKRFTHIDSRANMYHAICVNNVYYTEPTYSLKQGDNNNAVKWVQYCLNYLGYKMAIDGSFGAGTKLAVKDFQRKCGLTVDGICGKNTINKIKEMLS